MRRHARPLSLTARLAGARWWGYLPAHTVLLPRHTLRELISARGLVISEDVAFVRTFAAPALGRRAGRAPRAVERAADARPSGCRRSRSASLGDERVILAHGTPSATPLEPLLHERATGARGPRRPARLQRGPHDPGRRGRDACDAADRALLIDDDSPDDTSAIAREYGLDVLRHPPNRGYGAAASRTATCARCATAPTVIVMVHADNQYDPGLVAEMAAPILAGDADMVIGSRLLDDGDRRGMPRWKWLSNRLLTAIENRAFRRALLRVPHGLPRVLADFLRSIRSCATRRLRVRPGDLRPDWRTARG